MKFECVAIAGTPAAGEFIRSHMNRLTECIEPVANSKGTSLEIEKIRVVFLVEGISGDFDLENQEAIRLRKIPRKAAYKLTCAVPLDQWESNHGHQYMNSVLIAGIEKLSSKLSGTGSSAGIRHFVQEVKLALSVNQPADG